jgi:hypothetical protein
MENYGWIALLAVWVVFSLVRGGGGG